MSSVANSTKQKFKKEKNYNSIPGKKEEEEGLPNSCLWDWHYPDLKPLKDQKTTD